MLFVEVNAGDIGQNGALSVFGVLSDGVAVDEDEVDVGVSDSGAAQGGLLEVAGANNDLGAAFDSGGHGVEAVIVGGLIAVAG